MTIEPKQFHSLIELLQQIEGLHQRLVSVLRSKIGAIKVALLRARRQLATCVENRLASEK